MSKVRSSSSEETPAIQIKINPSKMVGAERGHQRADRLKLQSQTTSQSDHTRTTALSNSVKLSHAMWGHPRQTGHGGEVWQMLFTGEGNGKPLQYFALRNHEQYEKEKDRTLKDELPRSVGAQYATRDQWGSNSGKNERMEPKRKWHPVADVTGDRSKV